MIKQSLCGVEAWLLVGGPAGCGKTTIAKKIMACSNAFDLPVKCPEPFHRTDWKSLSNKKFNCGTVIVEFATNKLNDAEQRKIFSEFIDMLKESAPIMCAYTCEINRKTLTGRYFGRMTAEQFLHTGKWKSLIRYVSAPSDDLGVTTWKNILNEKKLKIEYWPPKSS